jgi:hypothetical protein
MDARPADLEQAERSIQERVALHTFVPVIAAEAGIRSLQRDTRRFGPELRRGEER